MTDSIVSGAEPTVLGITEIMGLIAHRYPMLLLDRVVAMDSQHAIGLKNVTVNEPCFQGHFPGRPLMPGVLIVEGMAQLAGVWVMREAPPDGDGWLPSLTGIDQARFRRPVVPGDTLRYEISNPKGRRSAALIFWRFDCRASVDGQLVCDATISAAFSRPERT
ncbi:MAG: 3-hydroxyacyl-ACP dehydratase FabZ [Deltaproteobacteria bacterium]|jgi:3-hydroxyacyl-[acyl-carrier-protein] dehydratase|nr:3-hydroxyacyl-ACP dehydratase FabZ [Deltaproteobacteria bacterium]